MTSYTQLQTTRLKHYPLKDKKIVLWKQTESKDEDGNYIQTYKRYKTLWAHYRQSSGREQSQAKLAQLDQIEDAHFIVNWYEWLNDTSYKVSFRGRVYNISRIDDYDGRHDQLELTATWDHNMTEEDLENYTGGNTESDL